MNLKEFAEKLNNRQYGYPQFTKEEIQTARENGFVIVYGQSDDLIELDGVLYGEGDCFDGGIAYFNKPDGKQDDEPFASVDVDGQNPEEEYRNHIIISWYGGRKDEKGKEIAWTYETPVPHETFMIYENDSPYCEGLVFRADDLK